MRRIPRTILPTPWMPYDFWAPLWGIGTPGNTFGASGWPGANRSILIPFQLPCDAQCYAIWARGNNTTGNYDLGMYDDDLKLIASKGSTAMAAALLEFTVNLRLYGGQTYYMAMACDNTTAAFARWAPAVPIADGVGVLMQTSAFPLPNPAVFAVAVDAYVPNFGLSARTVI